MNVKYLSRPPLQTATWTCPECATTVTQTSYYAEALRTVATHWCWVNRKVKMKTERVRGFVDMERTR